MCGKIKMKWNDRISRVKLYVLESLRVLSLINFIMLALVWKKNYNLTNNQLMLFGVVAGIFTILFGYILIELFKRGEQEEIMKKTPQIIEIQRSLKRIEDTIKNNERGD